MLELVTINVDGIYVEWCFDSIEDLRREWHKEDYSGPGSDDPVISMEFHGIPMYVNCFDDVIKLFGIDND